MPRPRQPHLSPVPDPEPQKAAMPIETPAERFRRLAKPRFNKLVRDMDLLGQTAENHKPTAEDAQKLILALDREFKIMTERLLGKKIMKDPFSD